MLIILLGAFIAVVLVAFIWFWSKHEDSIIQTLIDLIKGTREL